jgi:hypothetical protein
MIYPKKDYKFVRFEKSKAKNKKYVAILINKATGREKRINFGDKRYQQYKDSTGLGLYSHLNHNDPKRRANYRKRHGANSLAPYSANYFSYYYLW